MNYLLIVSIYNCNIKSNMTLKEFQQNIMPTYSKKLECLTKNAKITIDDIEFESISDYDMMLKFQEIQLNRPIQTAVELKK